MGFGWSLSGRRRQCDSHKCPPGWRWFFTGRGQRGEASLGGISASLQAPRLLPQHYKLPDPLRIQWLRLPAANNLRGQRIAPGCSKRAAGQPVSDSIHVSLPPARLLQGVTTNYDILFPHPPIFPQANDKCRGAGTAARGRALQGLRCGHAWPGMLRVRGPLRI